MKILGIIPARGGSKGVPGKNSKRLGGKPLIEYTIEKAQSSLLLSEVIVSTDSHEIAEIAVHKGVKVPFLRPAELATDTASSLSVLQHAVLSLEALGFYYDAVCLLQPTTPFRGKDFIDKAIQEFQLKNTDALVSVLPVPHEYNPHWVFEPDTQGYLKIATGEEFLIQRRQDLPKAYHRDGSIYLTKTSVIKSGSIYGNSISYIESNPEFYVNIDTFQDWDVAEAKLKLLQSKL